MYYGIGGCRLLAADSSPVQKTLQQLSSNAGQYSHIMYSDDPPPTDGIPAPDDPEAVLTQGKGVLVRTRALHRHIQSKGCCLLCKDLCAVLAQTVRAPVPEHAKMPVGRPDLAAAASSPVWGLWLTRLSMHPPGQGLGPVEGFWITHSLPSFPLPPGSSQSQSQGKLPGSPLQALQICFHPFHSMLRCTVAWPQHISYASCLEAPSPSGQRLHYAFQMSIMHQED